MGCNCTKAGKPPLDNELESGGRLTVETHNNQTTLSVRDVQTSDTGKYTLSVENTRGKDTCSTYINVEDVPNPPQGQPRITNITGKSLTLSWSGPAYDGGSPVKGYTIEMCKDKDRRWSKIASDVSSTSHTVRGLDPYTDYLFRVRAENAHGPSDPGPVSEPVSTSPGSPADAGEGRAAAGGGTVGPQVETKAGTVRDEYEVKEEIGRGRYGVVYRCIEKVTYKEYAVKIVRTSRPKMKQAVKEEVDTMNALSAHPKLVACKDAYDNDRKAESSIVMENLRGGELFDRITKEDYQLTEREAVQFMKQLCEGVKHMHERGYLHLDLKPENVLCVSETSNQIKLIDFGMSRKSPQAGKDLKVHCGTPEFVAPEVVNYDPVSEKSDSWSIGVIAYVLLSGISPFLGEDESRTLSNVTGADWEFDPKGFKDISPEAKDFINKLLQTKPESRMSVKECLQHPWLSQDLRDIPTTTLDMERHKKWLAKRKLRKAVNAIRLVNRMVRMHSQRQLLNDDDLVQPPTAAHRDHAVTISPTAEGATVTCDMTPPARRRQSQ